jgi:hypothetical protein
MPKARTEGNRPEQALLAAAFATLPSDEGIWSELLMPKARTEGNRTEGNGTEGNRTEGNGTEGKLSLKEGQWAWITQTSSFRLVLRIW